MGILTKLLGAKWECANCKKAYRKAPRKCSNCGHTVYNRVRDD